MLAQGMNCAPNQYPVYLSNQQRQELEAVCRHGHAPAKKIQHARVLLLADHNRLDGHLVETEIAHMLGLHRNTVSRIRRRFVQQGMAPAVNRKIRQRPPVAPIVDGDVEAHLVALCCSDPPEGRSCWTMELLAKEMVKRKFVTRICDETVRRALKKRAAALA